jgi:hypothetical protein
MRCVESLLNVHIKNIHILLEVVIEDKLTLKIWVNVKHSASFGGPTAYLMRSRLSTVEIIETMKGRHIVPNFLYFHCDGFGICIKAFT